MTIQPEAGRRILIVEDEMMIAMMLEDMLTDLGYGIAGLAAKPDQALAAIAQGSIDAAILDVNLDGRNSYEIAAALTEKGVPFLFSTGYSALALDERYRGRRLLQKPFRQDELGIALNAVLSEKDRA
jgi:DNA-binding response OmpR family regulator